MTKQTYVESNENFVGALAQCGGGSRTVSFIWAGLHKSAHGSQGKKKVFLHVGNLFSTKDSECLFFFLFFFNKGRLYLVDQGLAGD